MVFRGEKVGMLFGRVNSGVGNSSPQDSVMPFAHHHTTHTHATPCFPYTLLSPGILCVERPSL